MKEENILINQIVLGLQEKKAKKIVIADMSEIEDASFRYFVICEGTSTTHVSTIADNMIDYVRDTTEARPYAYDGFQNCHWVGVDYGDTLVHVFLPEYREFYKLEQLWADAKLSSIPDLD